MNCEFINSDWRYETSQVSDELHKVSMSQLLRCLAREWRLPGAELPGLANMDIARECAALAPRSYAQGLAMRDLAHAWKRNPGGT